MIVWFGWLLAAGGCLGLRHFHSPFARLLVVSLFTFVSTDQHTPHPPRACHGSWQRQLLAPAMSSSAPPALSARSASSAAAHRPEAPPPPPPRRSSRRRRPQKALSAKASNGTEAALTATIGAGGRLKSSRHSELLNSAKGTPRNSTARAKQQPGRATTHGTQNPSLLQPETPSICSTPELVQTPLHSLKL